MTSQKARTLLLTITLITMVACAPLHLPTGSAPVSTLAPGELQVIIAQTAAAAASETAILLPPTQTPTLTPSPTVTASLTPSSTPTFLFVLSTTTKINTLPADSANNGNKDFSCQIINVFPADGAEYSPKTLFIAAWTVTNSGLSNWDSNNMDYLYVKGDQLQVHDTQDLNESVSAGGTTTLTANMKAPAKPGIYSTVWNLRSSKILFCALKITIVVK